MMGDLKKIVESVNRVLKENEDSNVLERYLTNPKFVQSLARNIRGSVIANVMKDGDFTIEKVKDGYKELLHRTPGIIKQSQGMAIGTDPSLRETLLPDEFSDEDIDKMATAAVREAEPKIMDTYGYLKKQDEDRATEKAFWENEPAWLDSLPPEEREELLSRGKHVSNNYGGAPSHRIDQIRSDFKNEKRGKISDWIKQNS
jgi:hypothetical protein